MSSTSFFLFCFGGGGGGGGGGAKLTFSKTSFKNIINLLNGLDSDQVQHYVVLENYFLYFSTKTYVVGTQKNRLNERVLLSTQNTCFN